MLDFFNNAHADCVCGMAADNIENIKKAYTMNFDHDGVIAHLIEKPKKVYNNYKGTGYCIMSQSMLNILDQLNPNPIRNEYEMGDWIQLAINKGLKCMAYNLAQKDFNINEAHDITYATQAIMEGII